MKVTVITVCLNASKTIQKTLESVAHQTYPEIEHLVVDGGSVDDTLLVVARFGKHVDRVVTGKDSGIYDALNKGFALASGDIVGVLHADDAFIDSAVIADIVASFFSDEISFVYGDVDILTNQRKLIRQWKTGELGKNFIRTRQIPHPSFYLRRSVIERLGVPFDTTYKIAGDLKQQLMILGEFKLMGCYIPRSVVQMTHGGRSSKNFSAVWLGWHESARAWNEIFGSGGLFYVFRKVLQKFAGLRGVTEFMRLFLKV